MNKIKTYISITGALLILLCLGACGPAGEEGTPAQAATETAAVEPAAPPVAEPEPEQKPEPEPGIDPTVDPNSDTASRETGDAE